ncbi:MAG: twin-arginine translocase subunit TatC [Verrucomicrobiales bacterium]
MLKTVFQNLFRLREKASRRAPGADDGFDAHEKPFLDHLDDLRQTLFKIFGTLAISTACFVFHIKIFELVQLPAKSPLAEIAPGVSLHSKLDLVTLGPTELIFLMFKLSFYAGIIITFPFLVFFIFQFLMPGLRQAEKRTIIPGVGIGFILFLIGGAFAFFLATPLALKYFYQFEEERLTGTDPIGDVLARPITEVGLIGFDGVRYPAIATETATPPEAEPVTPPAPEAVAPATPEGETATPAAPEVVTPPAPEAEKATSPAPEGSSLTPELKKEIRNYLIESLATEEGSNFTLRYDEVRDKMVLVPAKGGKSSYQIGKYISFISQLVLVFGISFQMPIVVTILVKLELLTARVMRSTRSYAWVIIFVVAAVLTPSPDAFTMGLLAVPLIFLYEICIVIATIIEKAREKRERAEELSRKSRLEQLYMKPASDLSEDEKAEMHKAEIEQYEREHEHLYLGDSEHVARDGLHGDDSHDSGETGAIQHDESWHADDHYWHDQGHHDDPHHGMESDHAEKEDLEPSSEDEADINPENGQASSHNDYESCIPDGPVVDLNHATEEELKTLPGIGPKMAQVIIANRPYRTFDDLDRVPGLGPEKIQRITDRIMMG